METLDDTVLCLHKQYAQREKDNGNTKFIRKMYEQPYNCYECVGMPPNTCPNYTRIKDQYRGLD